VVLFNPKKINLLPILSTIKFPYSIKDCLVSWVQLSTLLPLVNFSRFNNNGILWKPSTINVWTLHQDQLLIVVTSSQLKRRYLAFYTIALVDLWCMFLTICQLLELNYCLLNVFFTFKISRSYFMFSKFANDWPSFKS
jgi:hypothetical protein